MPATTPPSPSTHLRGRRSGCRLDGAGFGACFDEIHARADGAHEQEERANLQRAPPRPQNDHPIRDAIWPKCTNGKMSANVHEPSWQGRQPPPKRPSWKSGMIAQEHAAVVKMYLAALARLRGQRGAARHYVFSAEPSGHLATREAARRSPATQNRVLRAAARAAVELDGASSAPHGCGGGARALLAVASVVLYDAPQPTPLHRRQNHHHRQQHCAHAAAPRPSHAAVDVAFFSEAYLPSQREKFFADARAVIDEHFAPANAPFHGVLPLFNFHAVFVPSNASRIDDGADDGGPASPPSNNTAFRAYRERGLLRGILPAPQTIPLVLDARARPRSAAPRATSRCCS